MTSIVEWLIGALANWATSWLQKRSAAAAQVKAATNKAEGEAHSAAIGDEAAVAVEKARVENDDQVNRVRADAGPDGLRKQSTDVQSAIDAANRELPGT